MDLLILLVAVGLLLLLFRILSGWTKNPSSKQKSPLPREEKVLEENKDWLEERWDRANREKESGELKTIHQWFFDDVTEHQVRKLEEIGLEITVRTGKMTKGQASDLIGLFEPIEDENEEILRFFKIPLQGMNESRARDEVAKLLSEPDKLDAWKNRPASPMQKEFYRFFDLRVPKDLRYEDASAFISEYQSRLAEEDEQKLDEWNLFEEIYEEINDPDFRDDYELRKISVSLYRQAIQKLKEEGKTLSELDADTDIVVDKIMELKPEMRKG